MPSIKAKKSLGQNFLIDEEALFDIAHSIEVRGKHIIEVGPGYGALTDYLVAEDPLSLDLVELDRDMVEILCSKFKRMKFPINGEQGIGVSEGGKLFEADESRNGQVSNEFFSPSEPFVSFQLGKEKIGGRLNIHHQDILTFTPPYLEYSVIANIPYYITSPILFHFLYPKGGKSNNGGESKKRESEGGKLSEIDESRNGHVNNEFFPPSGAFDTFQSGKVQEIYPPKEMIIMMQQEVGEKILEGRARKPHHSYLSLAMELACDDIEIVRYVGKESFDPAPKVDSIVLKFTVKASRNRRMEEQLLALWRTAFSHPRKTFISNLKGSHYDIESVKKWLTDCGYDEKVRAEAVRKEDWGKFI